MMQCKNAMRHLAMKKIQPYFAIRSQNTSTVKYSDRYYTYLLTCVYTLRTVPDMHEKHSFFLLGVHEYAKNILVTFCSKIPAGVVYLRQ